MPRASVLVPAFRAGKTYQRALQSLEDQIFKDFELIVIETGPPSGIEGWLDQNWPEATYLYDRKPKLPHDALNLALEHSSAELCVFTDIDAYPAPDWLTRLVAAFDQYKQPIFGGVKCFGSRLVDRGAHLVKFDKWLSTLDTQFIDEGPTVNFLIPRQLLMEAGGFRADTIHADTDLSWRLRARGHQIRLVPEAVVEHHHLHSWWSLLLERYQRGASFATYLPSSPSPGPARPILRGLIGILPLRLANQLWRVFRHAHMAGFWFDYLVTLPVVASGLYAWLLGESLGYLKRGDVLG